MTSFYTDSMFKFNSFYTDSMFKMTSFYTDSMFKKTSFYTVHVFETLPGQSVLDSSMMVFTHGTLLLYDHTDKQSELPRVISYSCV